MRRLKLAAPASIPTMGREFSHFSAERRVSGKNELITSARITLERITLL